MVQRTRGEADGNGHARTLVIVGGAIAVAVAVMWALRSSDMADVRAEIRDVRQQQTEGFRELRNQISNFSDYLIRKGEGK